MTITAYPQPNSSFPLYAQLYDSSGYVLRAGTVIQYTIIGVCQIFSLQQGCLYVHGCSGYYIVNNGLPAPSLAPTVQPSGPSLLPSASSRNPTGPSSAPYFASSVNCGYFSATSGNSVPCLFRACGGNNLYVSFGSTSYFGEPFVKLLDSSGLQVASGNYSFIFVTPESSTCQTYTLQ